MHRQWKNLCYGGDYGAGIGAARNQNANQIVVYDGEIEARGNHAAGIGSSGGTTSNIATWGGTIKAYVGNCSAGIGCGYNKNGAMLVHC